MQGRLVRLSRCNCHPCDIGLNVLKLLQRSSSTGYSSYMHIQSRSRSAAPHIVGIAAYNPHPHSTLIAMTQDTLTSDDDSMSSTRVLASFKCSPRKSTSGPADDDLVKRPRWPISALPACHSSHSAVHSLQDESTCCGSCEDARATDGIFVTCTAATSRPVVNMGLNTPESF